MGTLGLAPLVRVATDFYGWRGAMLIMAAMTTHLFLAAIVMWPVKWQWRMSSDVIVECEKDVMDKVIREDGCNGQMMQSYSNDFTCKDISCVRKANGYQSMPKDKPNIIIFSFPSDISKKSSHDSLNNNNKCNGTHHMNSKSTGECLSSPAECSKLEIQTQEIKHDKRKAFDFDIFKNIDFVAYCIALIFMNTAIAAYLTFLPSIAMSHGTTALSAANLIAWGSISGMSCFLYYLHTFSIIL